MSAMRTAGHTFLVLTTNSLAVAAGLISSILTARYLGPSGRGVLVVVNTTTSLLTLLAGLGLSYSLAYFVGKGRMSPANALGLATLTAAFMGAAFVVVGVVVWIIFAETFLRGIDVVTLLAGLLMLPAALFFDLWYSVRTVLKDFTTATRLQNLSTMAMLLVTAYVLTIVQAGPRLLLLGTTLTVWTMAAVAWVTSSRRDGVSFRIPLPLAREVIKYGLTVYAGSLVNSIYLRLDSYILNATGGTGQVGRYSIAVTLNEKLWLVESSLGQATLPGVISGGREEAARLSALTARTSTIATAVPAVGLAIAAPWLVPLLYGQEFASAVLPLQLLLMGTVVYPAGKSMANYFSGQLGRPHVTSILAAVTAVVSVGLFVLLIPRYGAVGAAGGSSLAYLGVTAVLVWLFTRNTELTVRQVLQPSRADLDVYRNVAGRVWSKARTVLRSAG